MPGSCRRCSICATQYMLVIWHYAVLQANVLRCGGHPINLAVPEAYDTALATPFKGNMDVEALEVSRAAAAAWHIACCCSAHLQACALRLGWSGHSSAAILI